MVINAYNIVAITIVVLLLKSNNLAISLAINKTPNNVIAININTHIKVNAKLTIIITSFKIT